MVYADAQLPSLGQIEDLSAGVGSPRPSAGEGLGVRGTDML